MEALLAKKLTSGMVAEAGKGMARKWLKDKTTPKESLLAAFGAEDHGLVVRHLCCAIICVSLSQLHNALWCCMIARLCCIHQLELPCPCYLFLGSC